MHVMNKLNIEKLISHRLIRVIGDNLWIELSPKIATQTWRAAAEMPEGPTGTHYCLTLGDLVKLLDIKPEDIPSE